ncbi:hypothetical protein AUJ42_01420 [Candidatus Collierbacteria bacterium CG1_02_44_10]|uniref:PrsW family intramembrane metalloprotease n=2 Tax=Candidatus Collieribacteriota TaxID=1752725 RepID=A0A2H0DU19_9BACT|nr:MAG: hypothetical protein AUJ42_01420 [Candidatus Collierbacteria bacterium CG1_02_44_10]PIP85368.1 MAG: hypothetical protein COW83_04620 [Candidatus Collierbacteria bacterium CG22_combo_CG10-13_8_21_14_all_43_12]PIZ24414.1 MAG: hypothetical protein COY48_03165 [Candidatus Collierbacteria bacterium CG_4_10_14_0_8_um_filter_43_86]
MNYLSLLPLIAAFSIFPLWLIEQYLPYPWFIEELLKYFFNLQINRSKIESKLKLAFLTAISFALSESFLYLSLGAMSGSLTSFLQRLLLTVPMHIATFLVLFYGCRHKPIIRLIALASTMTIHYYLNRFLAV